MVKLIPSRLWTSLPIRKYVACYMLALWIFAFSLFRDKMFIEAIKSQPQSERLDKPEFMVCVMAAGLFDAAAESLSLCTLRCSFATSSYQYRESCPSLGSQRPPLLCRSNARMFGVL